MDRRRHLPLQPLTQGGGCTDGLRVDVIHNGDARVADFHCVEVLGQPVRRWLHEGAMERRAHVQQDGALRAALLCQFHSPRYRRFVPGNHHLAGRIEVRRRDDLALSRLATNLLDGIGPKAEQRRHRTEPHRHGFLHVLAALSNQPNRFGQRHRARCDESGILAQAMPRHEIRAHAIFFEHPRRCHRDGQNRGLSVGCQLQLLGGSLKAKF